MPPTSLADPGGDPAGFFGGDTALVPRAALELLKLKDLAMDSVVEGITIADAALPDMPLIYANRAFARITGYSVADTLGKNCRFLQGPGTDPEEVAVLRGAVKGGRPCVVQLLNYRKNGEVTGGEERRSGGRACGGGREAGGRGGAPALLSHVQPTPPPPFLTPSLLLRPAPPPHPPLLFQATPLSTTCPSPPSTTPGAC